MSARSYTVSIDNICNFALAFYKKRRIILHGTDSTLDPHA